MMVKCLILVVNLIELVTENLRRKKKFMEEKRESACGVKDMDWTAVC